MKAIFVTLFPHEQSLPPMSSDDGECLHYDDNGTLRGGYACIGHVPQPAKTDTCMVLVEASVAVLTAMRDSPKYLFLARLQEDDTPVLAERDYLVSWLQAHPVYFEKVKDMDISTVPEFMKAVCKWHGVDRADLAAAGILDE